MSSEMQGIAVVSLADMGYDPDQETKFKCRCLGCPKCTLWTTPAGAAIKDSLGCICWDNRLKAAYSMTNGLRMTGGREVCQACVQWWQSHPLTGGSQAPSSSPVSSVSGSHAGSMSAPPGPGNNAAPAGNEQMDVLSTRLEKLEEEVFRIGMRCSLAIEKLENLEKMMSRLPDALENLEKMMSRRSDVGEDDDWRTWRR